MCAQMEERLTDIHRWRGSCCKYETDGHKCTSTNITYHSVKRLLIALKAADDCYRAHGCISVFFYQRPFYATLIPLGWAQWQRIIFGVDVAEIMQVILWCAVGVVGNDIMPDVGMALSRLA